MASGCFPLQEADLEGGSKMEELGGQVTLVFNLNLEGLDRVSPECESRGSMKLRMRQEWGT